MKYMYVQKGKENQYTDSASVFGIRTVAYFV